MKILIAYDGSECSDAAIADLHRAGLPADAEAMVLSVAQPAAAPHAAMASGSGAFVPESISTTKSPEQQLAEAQGYANRAADRLRAEFGGWRIATEASVESAAAGILQKADAWGADLIVVGSHGRTGIGRMLMGSVSQFVMHRGPCSVRISRCRAHWRERAIRIIVGVDGSDNARAAVRAAAARRWPASTQGRVVGVLDTRIPIAAAGTLEGTVPVSFEEESRRRMSRAVQEAVDILSKSGLRATGQVPAGVPDEVLVAEADKSGADCLFVGARGLNALERLMLGSVSTAVALHATCSVEIIRP